MRQQEQRIKDSFRRRLSPEQATTLLCTAIVASAVAWTVWEIQNDRRNTLADGARTADMAVAALEQHTIETFAEATSPMSSMQQLMALAGGIARVTPQRAHQWLKALTPSGTPIDRLVLFDSKGVLYATTPRPNPPQADMYAKHPAVAPHIAGHTGDRLLVEVPLELPADAIFFDAMTAPGSSRWVIPVTRSIRDTEGRTDAIVGALFRVDYFKEFYGILGPYRDASIALLREDGVLLARHPFRAEHLGINTGNNVQALKTSAPAAGPLVLRSPLDNIERVYAARGVRGLPLIVVVGLSTDDLLQPWQTRAIQRSIALAVFCAVVIALTVLVLFGLSRRRAAENQLQRLNLDLEQRVHDRTATLAQLNADLEAFSYSASHDLRAPIRRIRSFADMLIAEHGEKIAPEAIRLITRIQFSAEQMDGALNDLLVLFQANQTPMQPRSLNLGEIARDIVEDIRADQPERQIEVQIQTEGMDTYGDEGLIRLALTNLLSNAWKYSANMPLTKIAIGRNRQGFFVQDNGVGFDMRHAGQLFVPFARLHSDREFEGSGIGLAIVKRVIERHAGTIRAESAPGRGATFYFTLALH